MKNMVPDSVPQKPAWPKKEGSKTTLGDGRQMKSSTCIRKLRYGSLVSSEVTP